MYLLDQAVPLYLGLIGWLIMLSAGLLAAVKAPWSALRAEPWRIQLVIASLIFLVLLWSLRAEIMPGLVLFIIGITAVVLTIGLGLALLVGLAATVITQSLYGDGWLIAGWHFVAVVLVPALITFWVVRAGQKHLPANFFIYLFLGVFLSGILAAVATSLLTAGLMVVSGLYSLDSLLHNYLAMTPLRAFPEGVVNGMLMTGLALMVPHWVISYDDKRYTHGQEPPTPGF